MARPRVPKARARATGASEAHKERFAGRNEPDVKEGVGDAPTYLRDKENSKEIEAWNTIRDEIPWLNRSHRIHVAGVCKVLGKVIAGQDVGVQALNLMRIGIGQMGATPADASKAGVTPNGEGEDPADQYFK